MLHSTFYTICEVYSCWCFIRSQNAYNMYHSCQAIGFVIHICITSACQSLESNILDKDIRHVYFHHSNEKCPNGCGKLWQQGSHIQLEKLCNGLQWLRSSLLEKDPSVRDNIVIFFFKLCNLYFSDNIVIFFIEKLM